MSAENQIYTRLDRIENKLDENTKTTQQGFERINGRVKKLETKEAYNEGFDKGMQNGSIKTWGFWKKISLIIGIILSIITLGTIAASLVSKVLI